MARYPHARRRGAPKFVAAIAAFVFGAGAYTAGTVTVEAACTSGRTITANVVVLDSPTVFNRLGAQNPNWITYALRRDVVVQPNLGPAVNVPVITDGGNGLADTAAAGDDIQVVPVGGAVLAGGVVIDPGPDGVIDTVVAGDDVAGIVAIAADTVLSQVADGQLGALAGQVVLRPDKRPRPLVVRSAAGDCLKVVFTNLLDPGDNPNDPPANPNNCPAGPNQAECLLILDNNNQVASRMAGFHPQGVELVGGMGSDASFVGKNASSLVAPGATTTYSFHTPHEGTFTVNSYGATIGSEANGGNLGLGMFAQLNVQPKGATMYRSQVTEEEMRLASSDPTTGEVRRVASTCTGAADEVFGVTCNPGGQPIIDYEAVYPDADPWISEGKAGLPILNMLDGNELVHSDINAIIVGTGPNDTFLPETYPLESVGKNVPNLPNRLEPFREFSSIFHDEQTNAQVFPNWYNDPVLSYTLHGVPDAFMINYGSGGIGSEIIANRLHTGPMHDCTDCAYEEFFLASQTVGDPGMLVEFPANTGIETCDPAAIDGPTCWRDTLNLANGPIPGNIALYQEDPANVHHAYTGDFVKIRNIHAGAFEQHIFHLHNHQWLFNPNDDNANYIDAQEIMPGSGHTYELVNGGAGNRNKTTGDAIFHCHFYPHFAQGMWYHIRNHDVMETGTVLAVSGADNPQTPNIGFHEAAFDLRSGKPAVGARALPDGELPDGTPIPAVVPLPGKPMPQMPARVSVAAVDRGGFSLLGGRVGPDTIPDSSQAVVDRTEALGPDGIPGTADDVSPGFPFWLAGNECGVPTGTNACPQGVVGQRMPTPPLDMLSDAAADAIAFDDQTKASWPALAGGWDGGLPRHALLGYVSGGLSHDTQNRLDFSKIVERAQPVYFPETGTDLEQVSMAYQAVRERPSSKVFLDGTVESDNPLTPAIEVAFVLNGAPPVPGGPFNDPCVDDQGDPLLAGETGDFFDGSGGLSTLGASPFSAENPRTYKVANIQIDAVFNKVGYHYPQERIIALWEDVAPTINKLRPPEPLTMRFNTFDCGKLLHTNLVPAEFELDDFQVRTPTDIIGQHIHLPKWDLTTNDGAANGWNYEDGALSPAIVVERIHAINAFNLDAGVTADLGDLAPVATLPNPCQEIDATATDPLCGTPGGLTHLDDTVEHPFFELNLNNPQTDTYVGARTVIQRLFVDPIVNVAGVDRGLGMTFSHDHYGPSTFQQIGLYSSIIAEPAGSTWVHNESGDPLNDYSVREDGGPTSWHTAILTGSSSPAFGEYTQNVGAGDIPDHREFYLEMSDFQHAYEAGVYVGADENGLPLRVEITQPVDFNATQATAGVNARGFDLAQTWQQTVNPPLKLKSVPFPDVVTAQGACPGAAGNADGAVPRPCAEAINISHSSMFVVNYRNEPVGLRVFDPNKLGPDGKLGTQAGGLNQLNVDVPPEAGDLAFAFQSRNDRAIADLNTSFGNTPYPSGRDIRYCQGGNGDAINCDRNKGDPFTPIMRAYENDEVKVKIQVGATEEQHQVTIHGMKWLSNGSGFGRSPNSGWRNFQSHGISEQFSLQVPVNPDRGQRGNTVDYLYATDATRDGIWTGSWGLLRSYGSRRQDLFELPDNPQGGQRSIVNQNQFVGVCPDLNQDTVPDNLVAYDVTAVLANDVLPNNLGVTIPSNLPDADGLNDNEGGPLNTAGGTLVYNRRGTAITACDAGFNEQGECLGTPVNVAGPLNDPTAMMYVRMEDLEVVVDPLTQEPPPVCSLDPLVNPDAVDINPDPLVTELVVIDPATDLQATDPLQLPGCPVRLADTAPVEPLVLRANAGQCIEVTLRNRLPAVAPDLAGWQDMMWVVKRNVVDQGLGPQMHFFNNNLIRPSSHVGLHPQLVEYDASRHDGLVVGGNAAGGLLAPPGGATTARWYAGDLRHEPVAGRGNQRNFEIVATPVEFGGVNLLSADRVKQPQKGLFGALVIEPTGACHPDSVANPPDCVPPALDPIPDGQGSGGVTRLTRAQATVTSLPGDAGSGGTYREALTIGHKIGNIRWADGSAVMNINQGELGREGAEDSGHAGFNYAMEPSWFRFHLPPNAPFGNAGTANSYGSIPNAHEMYANLLVAGEPNSIPAMAGVSAANDPVTPVFRAARNQATRMHVLNGASADRDGTFMLHGHLWQRDPFVCTGTSQDGTLTTDGTVALEGRCAPDAPVPSLALGLNPQGKYMGAEEGMGHVYGHWPILFDAGGSDGVTGDYLFRDYAPNGNRNGQFGILRVE